METNRSTNALKLHTSPLFWLNVLLILALFLSCAKDKGVVGPTGEKNSVLVINVEGVKAANIKVPKTKSGLSISGQEPKTASMGISASSNMGRGAGFSADVYAEQTQLAGAQSRTAPHGPMMEVQMNNPPSTSTMKKGNTYRLLIYEKNSGRLAGNVQAVAGTSISIEVYKGETYEIYAYSHNDDKNIPEPSDPMNPSVSTSIYKDLLYAHPADVTVPDQEGVPSVPVPLVFEHKVVQLSVRMDLTGLANYGDILNLRAEFVYDSHLREDVLNIKGGTLTGNLLVEPVSDITFKKDSVYHIYEANFYTSDVSAVTSIQVRLEELLMKFYHVNPADAVKDLATHLGGAKPVFTYNFPAPALGERLLGTAMLFYRASAKRILHVASRGAVDRGYAMESELGWTLLNSPINFGDDVTSAVRMEPDGSGKIWKGSSNANNMANNFIRYDDVDMSGNPVSISGDVEPAIVARLNSTNPSVRPDIMITGEGFEIRTRALADAMLVYLNDRGVVIMMASWSGGQVEYFFEQLLGTKPRIYDYGNQGYVYPFIVQNVNDRIMNGPFGNLNPRQPHWGSFNKGLMTLSSVGSNATIYSRGKASNSTVTEGVGINIFKHDLKDFFYIGTGQFTASGRPDHSPYTSPFELNDLEQPVPTPYGVAGNGVVAHQHWTLNSQFIGNVMAWAVAAAELNPGGSWKYAGAPR